MTIYFQGGQVLFNASSVAMDAACCCQNCNCTDLVPGITDYCTQCAAGDFPSSFTTPGGWQVDISGVVAGSNASCFLCGAATNNAFFNRSILFDPCDPTYEDEECIWLCKTTDTINNVDQHILELNYLQASAGTYSSGAWTGGVTLGSFVVQKNTAIGADPTAVCGTVSWDAEVVSGASLLIARSYFTQSFSRAAPTYQQYQYDPLTCDAECNTIFDLPGGCYPSSWALTGGTAGTQWVRGPFTNASCKAANDVTVASVAIYSV